MNIARTLGISLEVLMGHKLRTLLSSSGIAIGMAAVVLVAGVGRSAGQDVVNKVKSMGTNLIIVQAARFRNFGHRRRMVATYTTLKPRDVRLLKQRLGNARVCGFLQKGVIAKYEGLRTNTNLAGAAPTVFEIRGIRANEGRLYSSQEERALSRVAVLGPTVAVNLFKNTDPIGERIEVNKVIFKVIGVAAPRGQDLAGNDQDDVIYVPLRTAMSRVFHMNYLQSILVQAPDAGAMETLPPEITSILRRSHELRRNQKDDFTIQDQNRLMKSQEETSRAFTFLVGGVAGISLFTGGIGILAVMLISIRERTHEIGLRRALGGRKGDILTQFILEASSLSAIGGFAGLLIGMGGNYVICRILSWPLYWPWSASAIALALSFLMGVTFGLYPAMKAARLEPATALHSTG